MSLIVTPFFGELAFRKVGSVKFGWDMPELAAVFVGLGIVVGFIAGETPSGMSKVFVEGCKKMLTAAMIIGLASAIASIMSAGKIVDTVVYGLASCLQHTPAGNAVAQGQQGVHKVDVLKEHAGNLRGQLHVGEVPEAPDAQVDKLVRQGLGHVLGHRQHRHVGPVAGHILRQLVHGADGDAPDLGVHQRGGHVEGGVHLEAHLFEIEVLDRKSVV